MISGGVIRKALSSPLYWIANNAGLEGSVVVEKVRGMDADQGLNALTGEFGDLVEQGIVPANVTLGAAEDRVDRRPATDHRGARRRQA